MSNDAPSDFPLGETLVTWTVVDIAGNISIDTQLVTIIDDLEPEVLCNSVELTLVDDMLIFQLMILMQVVQINAESMK